MWDYNLCLGRRTLQTNLQLGIKDKVKDIGCVYKSSFSLLHCVLNEFVYDFFIVNVHLGFRIHFNVEFTFLGDKYSFVK